MARKPKPTRPASMTVRSRAAVLIGTTSPRPRVERGAAHVEVGSESGDAARALKVRADRPLHGGKADYQRRRPHSEQDDQRELGEIAEEELAALRVAEPAAQSTPDQPQRAQDKARDADVRGQTARQEDRLVCVPEDDRDHNESDRPGDIGHGDECRLVLESLQAGRGCGDRAAEPIPTLPPREHDTVCWIRGPDRDPDARRHLPLLRVPPLRPWPLARRAGIHGRPRYPPRDARGG